MTTPSTPDSSNNPASPDNPELLSSIDRLVAEEHELRERAASKGGHPGGLSEADRSRLAAVEVQLDQCWDLLRRRRARSEYGEDPTTEKARPANEVEGYLN
ncbi:hypothetical protein GCM10010329_19850 [Streptomyces spiroverticillatus]|uniref:DUF2630 family protein n=1 Tax=Streptomyces finlayi TaxID=67296 RepID=A0A918WU71_9ACTN|nr:DUF2630 family protein [Streptomyces finlayi]GGZ98405.1 hypothetical protein GCM10010329_19850 [Streptomyces spiroverticillatus]GHC83308.1 hypothetical protein GCM10010334_12290 [Streptomyces finlayi]